MKCMVIVILGLVLVAVPTRVDVHPGEVLAAGSQYITIDDPHATHTPRSGWGTAAMGITSQGEIAGVYNDDSSFPHGFVLQGSTYTTLDAPGAGTQLDGGTSANDIN